LLLLSEVDVPFRQSSKYSASEGQEEGGLLAGFKGRYCSAERFLLPFIWGGNGD